MFLPIQIFQTRFRFFPIIAFPGERETAALECVAGL